jgi:hypothetical protein
VKELGLKYKTKGPFLCCDETCKYFKKPLKDRKTLKTHMQSHLAKEGKLDFQCQRCEKNFASKSHLNEHVTHKWCYVEREQIPLQLRKIIPAPLKLHATPPHRKRERGGGAWRGTDASQSAR